MRYVIAYDICDPKRLRRIARRVERQALRTQKSVFLFDGDRAALDALLDAVAPLMDLKQDVVQAWKLAQDETVEGAARGAPLNVRPPAVVLAGGRWLLCEDRGDQP